MKLSAIITLNDRDINVVTTVFESMVDQNHDEFVIVLDGTPEPLAEYCRRYWERDNRTRFVHIVREPGWKSPVKAWNRGFASLTGDALYAFSSEVVQVPGNIDRARQLLLRDRDTVIFGKCECSCGPGGMEVNWGGTAPGNLLCSASHPRPLGFIWASPLKQVKEIGGFDEAFYQGYWYDENDLFTRLWRTGLSFTFDDSIRGTHLHHERPVLAQREGQEGIRRNAAHMIAKYGTLDPMGNQLRVVSWEEGRQIWRHL